MKELEKVKADKDTAIKDARTKVLHLKNVVDEQLVQMLVSMTTGSLPSIKLPNPSEIPSVSPATPSTSGLTFGAAMENKNET